MLNSSIRQSVGQLPVALPIRRATDGRVVAQLKDGVLFKRVKLSRHLYRTHDAWTVDEITYRGYRDKFHTLRMEDVENGLAYFVSTAVMDEQAIRIHHDGHGEQLALPRQYWQVEPLPNHQIRLL